MFTRLHHQAIAQVLHALDGRLLREHACLFGGGTVIAMRFGEYRESLGMDFLVSSGTGYRELRQLTRDEAFNRDLIDLAMMKPARTLLQAAVTKAERAYGNAIREDLAKAIDRVKNRTAWLERCMQAMAMNLPKALLWKHIRRLDQVL